MASTRGECQGLKRQPVKGASICIGSELDCAGWPAVYLFLSQRVHLIALRDDTLVGHVRANVIAVRSLSTVTRYERANAYLFQLASPFIIKCRYNTWALCIILLSFILRDGYLIYLSFSQYNINNDQFLYHKLYIINDIVIVPKFIKNIIKIMNWFDNINISNI